MLTRDVIDKLNELLSRELAALEWHDGALEDVVHVELAQLLMDFRDQHDQRITVLRNTICELIEEEVLCAIGGPKRDAEANAAPTSSAGACEGEKARRRPATSRRAITRRAPAAVGARRA